MYLIALGEKSKTKLAFLGPEHRASAALINLLSKDMLHLTEEETARMLNRFDIGRAAAADLFGRCTAPFRKASDSPAASEKMI